MRSIIALQALVVLASAQAESFTFGATRTLRPVTTGDIQPSATETISGPISTARACAQISELVDKSRLEFPSVEAELAFACLKSVPIDTDAASFTIDSLKQMLQFQSTLMYLKSPPKGYANDAVDLISGLDDIKSKVNSNGYSNEYDFETAIATLFVKAHDGHLSFDGMAYGGAFRWRRSRQVSLISASSDGKEPKIWALQDFNKTRANGFTPSAVSKIDGKDAAQFLQDESLLNAYHDPDTRYNAMFYMQPAESYGYFTNPKFYPGPTLNLTFENGTEHTYINAAVVLDSSAWSYISDGKDFYKTFVAYSSSGSKKLKQRNPQRLPPHLTHPKETNLHRRYVPTAYPKPVVEHSASDVGLAGYFIDTSAGTVGILMIQTFNTESNADAVEFQAVVQNYISQAQKRQVKKHIIDVRTNGGGKILLGYDTYKQFFPSQVPQLQSRYRGHQATDLIGSQLSSLSFSSRTGELYTSPFNFHSYLDKDLKAFTSWTNMYPPEIHSNDNFTKLLRYNLSDPLTTSSEKYSIGITLTGYNSRSNFTTDPFKAEDLIILSDGICASTCSLFTELMVQQSGVKTLAIGGRPALGPMQPVGGTKGSLVLQSQYLTSLSAYVIQTFASSRTEANAWEKFLPNSFGINAADATINFQDNIRKGLENDGVPTQFLNDSASCRIWYEPAMYLNVTQVWAAAAEVAFGNSGKLDEKKCVTGSVTSQQAQQGQGEGNPTTPQSSSSAKPSSSKGAAASVAVPKGGWSAILMCGGVVASSMVFGASLI
ncbi:uncharacterized protein BDR25DRAFT_344615 [Lindgomyces ingoldianus]|uniref:Uncharacterized protein n=1 Tax=Lindgomyces ingoldianus TaxID=673940 RepID=A0ACB6QLN3_9PLEO|nr:uncharacterized protein BDR25DRAFT_344615 [Lindgomyces ingoldianus]KAF2467853.1 hypothetical protein BDR25DRAFT_344615 [Lindgomyces ingoldianus]